MRFLLVLRSLGLAGCRGGTTALLLFFAAGGIAPQWTVAQGLGQQQSDDNYSQLLDEVESLRAALEQQRSENERWQTTFESRLQTAPATGQPPPLVDRQTGSLGEPETGQSDDAGTRQDVLRQLQRRVPSFEALPEASKRDLASDFQEINDNFVYIHGYLRSGAGANSEGGSLDVFRAPGAGAKYRLGNENDTYGELIFEKSSALPDDQPLFHGALLIAYQSRQNRTFDPDFDHFGIRESYVDVSNLAWVPEWHFWAGQRYYDRHDIHINDFYYLDMSGFGGGVTDINLGICTLDVAYLTGALEEFTDTGINEAFRVERGRLAKHNLDMRLQKVPVPLGEATLWMNLATSPGGILRSTNPDGTPGPNDGTRVESSDGVAFGAIHVREDVLGGFNKASILWGNGAASNFSTSLDDPVQAVNATSQFIATETLTAQPSDWFTMQATALYRVIENGEASDDRITWTSAGVRPIIHLTEYWAVAFEYGADHVDNEPLGVEGTVQKLTIAPELRKGNKFFSRPSIRTFVTHAVWPQQFKGLVGADGFRDQTKGTTLGCQFESWW